MAEWKNALFVGTLFAVFTLTAINHGWTTLEIYGGNIDPSVFISEAHKIARSGELITSRDAPARYFPLALIYSLTNPTGVLAEQLAILHAALFSFVVLPAAVGILAYVIGGRNLAYLSLILFGVTRLVGLGTAGFHTGAWHYDIAAPLVFLTFAAVHQSLTKTGMSVDRWAVGGGVTLGVLGMTQWTLTLITILITTVTFLAQQRYRSLTITGGVASMFATYLFFLPASSNGLMFSGFVSRILPDSGELFQTSHLVQSVTSPGFWIITIGVITITAYHVYQEKVITSSGILTISIAILYPVYLASAVLNLNYIGWVIVQVLIPVVYISGGLTLWQTMHHIRGLGGQLYNRVVGGNG